VKATRFARFLRLHLEPVSAPGLQGQELEIHQAAPVCLMIGDLALTCFLLCREMAKMKIGRTAVDPDFDSLQGWDFRRVAVADSFASRFWPSAAALIGRQIFDPDFGSIDSVIAPAGFVAVVVGSAAADPGFDPCCWNCFGIAIAVGPDPDFGRRRLVADSFCFAVVEAVALESAFSSDVVLVARFSF